MTTTEVQDSEVWMVFLCLVKIALSKTESYKLQVKDKTSKSSLLYTSIIIGKSSIIES